MQILYFGLLLICSSEIPDCDRTSAIKTITVPADGFIDWATGKPTGGFVKPAWCRLHAEEFAGKYQPDPPLRPGETIKIFCQSK
jgi:hypothetical protein